MGNRRTETILLITGILFFGLHILRVFIAMFIWNLDVYAGGAENIALFAVLVFATVLPLSVLVRWLGTRALLFISTMGIIFARLLLQFFQEPLVMIILSTAGVIMFMWFFTLVLQSDENRSAETRVPVLVTSLGAAFTIDVVSRAILFSYDITWRKGVLPGAAMVVIGLLLMLLVIRVIPWLNGLDDFEELPFANVLPVVAMGPWFFMMFAVYTNIPAVVAATGLDDVTAGVLVTAITMTGNFLMLGAGAIRGTNRIAAIFSGLVLICATWLFTLRIGVVCMWIAGGGIAAWVAPALIIKWTSNGNDIRPGLWRSSIAVFFMFLLFDVFVFVNAQFKTQDVVLYASILVAAGMVAAVLQHAHAAGADSRIDNAVYSVLAVAGIVAMCIWRVEVKMPVPGGAPPPGSLRVMTYNIHQSFDADYRVDLDDMADAIMKEDPDVVGLQEVNRGQLSNGMIDCLPYLARKLNMTWIFLGYHEDGQYGNALLRRYKITAADGYHYSTNLNEVRGITKGTITTKDDGITFYVTHLDHTSGEENVRKQQMGELISYWDGKPSSVIMGDFNAEPGSEPVTIIRDTPLVDVLQKSGLDQTPTFWEGRGEPFMHLDYIFVTPHLKYNNASIIKTRASDHMPVMVDLRR
ncbi:MAG: endonuclease/exonuclease/phosphatase family protein [Spirochaetota bacterium]